MKKNYFMLAAATMMFAACAETDLVNEINVVETQHAIEFDAFANKTTRAEITNIAGLQDAGFNVWGYKYSGNIEWDNADTEDVNESNYHTIFDGVQVTYDNGWKYTGGTQYWDQMKTYNFYAVSPKATITNNAPYSIANGLITINNAQHNVDYLLVRTPKTVAGSTKSAVELNFNHIMSKISFKLKAGVNEIIQVTSLKMSGYHNGTGTFQQVANFDASQKTHTEWRISDANTDGNTGEIVTDNDNLILDGTAETVSASSVLKNSYILMPQEIGANTLTFTISYNLLKEDNGSGTITLNSKKYSVKETFTDQTGKLAAAQNWYTDTHTTYTIVVTPDAIEFGDPTITNWSWSATDEKDEENLPL